jgi:hypothetical protein
MEQTSKDGYVCPMTWRSLVTLVTVLALAPRANFAQARPGRGIVGTWRAETPDGPREVVVRPDSSASYGEDTVRWRLFGDSLFLAFGDEWVGYVIAVKGSRLVISGGDLEDPMTLKRVGPARPRPDSIPLPPAPPLEHKKPVGTPGPPSG